MKNIVMMIIHWYQFAMNYSLYWRLRAKYQNGGGGILLP